jgi:4,5-DOPA dioxygenase extradiol
MQLSMDGNSLPAAHFALGQQLKALRDWGVLVVGSGNIVHNLRAIQRSATPAQAHDWALSFDHWAHDHVANGRLAELANHRSLGTLTQMAHPTDEHFLPLLYTAGAADTDEPVRFFNDNFQMSSISMRSMVWG